MFSFAGETVFFRTCDTVEEVLTICKADEKLVAISPDFGIHGHRFNNLGEN